MTPEQKLKLAILNLAAEWDTVELPTPVTADNVDDVYEQLDADGDLQDAREEIRCGEVRTDAKDPTPYMRGLSDHESESVAMQIDGSWVGWTHWYGGGKHAEPSAIPWMEYAYDLTCEEKQVTVTQRTFTKV